MIIEPMSIGLKSKYPLAIEKLFSLTTHPTNSANSVESKQLIDDAQALVIVSHDGLEKAFVQSVTQQQHIRPSCVAKFSFLFAYKASLQIP